MLDVFLDVGLDAAVGGPDLSGEAAHPSYVAAAEKEGERHDDHYYCCEPPVHGAEEDEGCEELEGGGYDCRYGACEGVCDPCDVAFEAVEHVSRMEGIPAGPAAFHDLDEVVVFQGIAYAYVGPCLEVADDGVECDLDHCAECEDDDIWKEPAVSASCGYVHEVFADPYVQEGYDYGGYADKPHQQDVAPESGGYFP